jgi:hypothetical protein
MVSVDYVPMKDALAGGVRTLPSSFARPRQISSVVTTTWSPKAAEMDRDPV